MKIFRNLPHIHLHPILLIFIIISFLTGTFIELIIILSLVFIHELGHYAMSQVFNWRVNSIMLWVFGGVMDTDEHGNKSIYEEMLVTIAGPFQHVIIYGLLLLPTNGILPPAIIELVFYYNTLILIFNLLPIWPLDGGKLLSLTLSLILPYRKAYDTTILLSLAICLLLLIIQFFILPFTLSTFFILIFLFMENRTEWKQRYYVFIRFLLSRYEGDHTIKKITPIVAPSHTLLMDVFRQFKRDKKHTIYVVYPNSIRKSVDESDCLHTYFQEKVHNIKISEVIDKML